jgi:hypothetical protein
MKALSFFCFSIIASTMLMAQTINLSDPVYVNQEVGSSNRPKIILVEGEPVIMFSRNTLGKRVYINRKSNGEWLGEQQVSPEGINFQVATRIGPAIASYGQTVYVAYIIESSPKQIAVQRSIDGGASFSELITAHFLDNNLAESMDMKVLPDGNPVIAFLHFGPGWSNPQQAVIRSYDGGNTFTNLVTVDDLPCECCEPTLLADEEKYGVVFRDNDEDIRTFKVRTSPNSIAEFTSPVETDPTNWEINVCPASSADGFFMGDTLYSAWMSKPGDLSQIFMSKTHLGEEQILDWSVVESTQDSESQNHPRMDGDSEFQLIAWEEYRNSKKDILAVLVQNGLYQTSVSLAEGDSIGHKETVDIAFDKDAKVFHIVYRNKNENDVVYRSFSPSGLSIDAIEELSITLYPNPATSVIRIDSELRGKSFYTVYNTLGKVVLSGDYTGMISIEELEQGNYFIELVDESNRYRSSFVKQ